MEIDGATSYTGCGFSGKTPASPQCGPCLALGIGANTAIFSVVLPLLAPLPYSTAADRIVIVWSKKRATATESRLGITWTEARQHSFESMLAWTGGQMSLTTSGQPEQVQAEPCTPGFLEVLGQPRLLGAIFCPRRCRSAKRVLRSFSPIKYEEPLRRRAQHPRAKNSPKWSAIHRWSACCCRSADSGPNTGVYYESRLASSIPPEINHNPGTCEWHFCRCCSGEMDH